jgi:aminoglycoside 2'-N-acetyltransferase I
MLAAIRRLLDIGFDGDFSQDDWEHTIGGLHVVVVEDGVPIAHASVVERAIQVAGTPFRTGYVEAVATHPGRQRQGLGSLMMERVGEALRQDFEMGSLSTSLPYFYARFGWERWRGPTFVRSGSAMVRTADEDDGVMVLRFGPSEDVDLTASISCETRLGDDW